MSRGYTDETDRCPDCGSELEHKGASNRLGTQSVSYHPCTGCRGYENIDGDWVSEDEVLRELNESIDRGGY